MKITADTNVLVRALTEDPIEQSKAAQNALSKADIVALTLEAISSTALSLTRETGSAPTPSSPSTRRL
jgi:predicted nucleic acid-binding protein